MKRSVIALLLAGLTMALCACSLIKTDPNQSSSQDSVASTDKVINYNVTIGEDGNVQYTDDQGNVLQVDSEWTDNDLTSGIPKPDFGEIISVSSLDDVCFVQLDNVTEQDITNYFTKLEEAGFTDNMQQKTTDGQLFFSGSQEKYYVYLAYDGSKTATVSVSYNEAVADVGESLYSQATSAGS